MIHLDFFQQIMKRNPSLKTKALACVGKLGMVNIKKVIYNMRRSILDTSQRRLSVMSRNKHSSNSPQSSVVRFIASASDKESLAKTTNPRQLKQELSSFFGNNEEEFQGMRKSRINRRRSISGLAKTMESQH